jgi:hypothetical protein
MGKLLLHPVLLINLIFHGNCCLVCKKCIQRITFKNTPLRLSFSPAACYPNSWRQTSKVDRSAPRCIAMRLDLQELILAVSNSVDLVGVDLVHHSKRVADMAWACARRWDVTQRKRHYFTASVFCTIVVSSTKVHKRLLNTIDWSGADVHCQIGAKRMARLPQFYSLVEPIRYPYNGKILYILMYLPKQKNVPTSVTSSTVRAQCLPLFKEQAK